MSDRPQEDGIGAEAGFGIDDSQIHIIRHPDNAGLARDNDVVKKDDEQPSE